MALIRYPGSKERLADQVLRFFPDDTVSPLWMNQNRMKYVEPFFGAGAIGFRMLSLLPPGTSAEVWDIDYGIVCLWQAVQNDPESLIKRIVGFVPSAQAYRQFKEDDGRRDLIYIESGFRKLALHQMSFSGLGAKSGGPLGGKSQDNDLYNVSCRWSAEKLAADVMRLHGLLQKRARVQIKYGHFNASIVDDKSAFLYCDPPYYAVGEQLYKHHMQHDDHVLLRDMLFDLKQSRWVLSYDDHPVIRGLYEKWAEIYEMKTTYTIGRANGDRPKNQEILIVPNRMIRRPKCLRKLTAVTQ